jgi:formate hydrogenlyase subunit 3/multisubunit Na+/H+ antiporter MnhD subunit
MNVLAQTARTPDPTAAIAAMGGAFLLVGLIFFALTIAAYYVILKKTGYNPWLSLLILLPGIGSLIILLMLVFTEWPVEREVKQLRAQLAMGGTGGYPPTGGAIVYPTA